MYEQEVKKSICSTHESALAAIDFAIQKLEMRLMEPSYLKWHRRRGEPPQTELRRDLLYFLQPTDTKDVYILVNRNYRPLGGDSSLGWVDYEKFQNLHIKLARKNILGEGNFFDDLNAPWASKASAKSYLKRLKTFRALLPTSPAAPPSIQAASWPTR